MTLCPDQGHDANFRNLMIIYLSNHNFKIKVQDGIYMHEKDVCKRAKSMSAKEKTWQPYMVINGI